MTTTNSAPTRIMHEAIREKMIAVLTPGQRVEFSLSQATQAGVFDEDALSEKDAMESNEELTDGGFFVSSKNGV